MHSRAFSNLQQTSFIPLLSYIVGEASQCWFRAQFMIDSMQAFRDIWRTFMCMGFDVVTWWKIHSWTRESRWDDVVDQWFCFSVNHWNFLETFIALASLAMTDSRCRWLSENISLHAELNFPFRMKNYFSLFDLIFIYGFLFTWLKGVNCGLYEKFDLFIYENFNCDCLLLCFFIFSHDGEFWNPQNVAVMKSINQLKP